MSKILAISDTHLTPLPTGNYYPGQLIRLIHSADLVLHAGDFTCQGAYDNLANLCAGCELWAIQGNKPNPNQPSAIIKDNGGNNLPMEKIGEKFGIRLLLMHDANNGSFFSEAIAAAKAADRGVDVLVFGHIHEPIIVWNKNTNGKRRLLVCPGPGSTLAISPDPSNDFHKCPPYPSVALLDIVNGDVSSAQIIPII